MRRFFAMMRYSKVLLILSICFAVELVLILGLCTFDIVQMIQMANNSVAVSSLLINANIVLISISALNLLALVVFLIIKKVKGA